jgi:glutamate 5-kinase
MNDAEYREQHVTGAARVVVKIGSGVLTKDGGLNVNRLGRICAQIHNLRLQNREIVLVSSGAIASGFKKIGLKEKPKGVRKFQACAAVGQAGLIMAYEKSLERRGHKVAQVLLTASDLFHRRRYINAKNTLTMLLEWSVIPIINENDTVAVDEIKFGDNDTLGGLVTGLVGADLFINLTDIQGLYDRDPRQNKNARFMSVIQPDTEGLDKVASRIPGALGAGGMYTKVVAARRLSRQGVPSVIASGNIPRVLERILDGQPIGTLFLP